VAELGTPAGAGPPVDELVKRIHRQIERYTATHTAERSMVEVELADGERLVLQSLSSDPGFGFVTLTVHSDAADPEQVIVPLGWIRRISLGPAQEERARFGFTVPEKDEGTGPAA